MRALSNSANDGMALLLARSREISEAAALAIRGVRRITQDLQSVAATREYAFAELRDIELNTRLRVAETEHLLHERGRGRPVRYNLPNGNRGANMGDNEQRGQADYMRRLAAEARKAAAQAGDRVTAADTAFGDTRTALDRTLDALAKSQHLLTAPLEVKQALAQIGSWVLSRAGVVAVAVETRDGKGTVVIRCTPQLSQADRDGIIDRLTGYPVLFEVVSA